MARVLAPSDAMSATLGCVARDMETILADISSLTDAGRPDVATLTHIGHELGTLEAHTEQLLTIFEQELIGQHLPLRMNTRQYRKSTGRSAIYRDPRPEKGSRVSP